MLCIVLYSLYVESELEIIKKINKTTFSELDKLRNILKKKENELWNKTNERITHTLKELNILWLYLPPYRFNNTNTHPKIVVVF